MLKITNISNRNVDIGGTVLAPTDTHTFEGELSNIIKGKINSLYNLGLIRMVHIEKPIEPVVNTISETESETTTTNIVEKKSSKKSK